MSYKLNKKIQKQYAKRNKLSYLEVHKAKTYKDANERTIKINDASECAIVVDKATKIQNNLGRLLCSKHYGHIYYHSSRNKENFKLCFILKIEKDYFVVDIIFHVNDDNNAERIVKLMVQKNPADIEKHVSKKAPGYMFGKCFSIPKWKQIANFIKYFEGQAYLNSEMLLNDIIDNFYDDDEDIFDYEKLKKYMD